MSPNYYYKFPTSSLLVAMELLSASRTSLALHWAFVFSLRRKCSSRGGSHGSKCGTRVDEVDEMRNTHISMHNLPCSICGGT